MGKSIYVVLGVVSVVLVVVLTSVGIHLAVKKQPVSGYSPVVIEVLRNHTVRIVQGSNKVTYTKREFSKLQFMLKQCLEHNPACSTRSGNSTACAYNTTILNVDLCMGVEKQVIRATVGKLRLHREDLLQIYLLR